MINSVEAKEFSISAEGPCRHHWILDPPKDSVSKGICKNCGEEKIFPNELQGKFGTIRIQNKKNPPVLD